MNGSLTDSFRKTCRYLFIIEVAASIGGWLLNKDPSQLVPIMWVTLGAMGIGEASNVEKRWTFDPAAAQSNVSVQTTSTTVQQGPGSAG